MLNFLLYVLMLCLSIVVSYYLTPLFIDIFYRGHQLAKNFRGELIPQGIGIVFPLYSFIWYALLYFILYFRVLYKSFNLNNIFTLNDILLIVFAIFAMSLLGFIDDVLGARDVTGLKGHFKSLLKGRLTTGALKAIFGGLVAFVISVFLSLSFTEIILNTLIIALSTNLLNLLDLRPGRCIKFYIFLMVIFGVACALSGTFYIFYLFIPLLGSILGFFPYDLKAKCMMGDSGSNVLGVTSGIIAVLALSNVKRVIYLVLLIGIHVFTEKYSLTEVIKQNKVLSFLDNLGR